MSLCTKNKTIAGRVYLTAIFKVEKTCSNSCCILYTSIANLPLYKQIKNAQNTVKSMVTVKPRFDKNSFIIVRFNSLVLINVNL